MAVCDLAGNELYRFKSIYGAAGYKIGERFLGEGLKKYQEYSGPE